MNAADEVPLGWSANPSAWAQRLPIVGLALAGTAIAAYLAAYQLRWIRVVWEPFFGEGSRMILTSSVSRILPIPDAALGMIGYLVDAVTGTAIRPTGGGTVTPTTPCSTMPHDFQGTHTMRGEVLSVDQQKGTVSLKSAYGTSNLHFPPPALKDVQTGDQVIVQMGLRETTATKP